MENDRKIILDAISTEIKEFLNDCLGIDSIVGRVYNGRNDKISVTITESGMNTMDLIIETRKGKREENIKRILRGDLYPSELCDLTGMDLRDATEMLSKRSAERFASDLSIPPDNEGLK